MPIVVQHQPAGAAVGLAAYAGGLGSAQERRRKHLLALYAEQQRMLLDREQMDAQREMHEERLRFTGMLAGQRLASDERMQEESFLERRQESDLEARRRAAEWRRREAEPFLSGRELSPRDQARDNALLDKIEDIEGSRDLTDVQRQSILDKLQEQRRKIAENSPRKPSRDEELEKLVGTQSYNKFKPLGLYLDENGKAAFVGGKMPELPEVLQREQEEEQRKAGYEESIHQWEVETTSWEDLRLERHRYEDFLWGLEENKGASRSEIMAKVDAEFGEFAPRPPWPGMGGQQNTLPPSPPRQQAKRQAEALIAKHRSGAPLSAAERSSLQEALDILREHGEAR